MKLSILICTTIDRRPLFDKLMLEFLRQKLLLDDPEELEILFDEDNKEISVGAKRQKLLMAAQGEYIVFFDSDDWPMPDYVAQMMWAIDQKPDCVGFLIHMTTNGVKPQTCCHSLKYKKWAEKVDGYNYVRNVTHFNPVRRELALRVGFKDMRYGEDHVYADAVTQLCSKEVFINKRLFHYRLSNKMPHKQKYGIKNS
jgi:glycosyltransferase involved in cell wall biosynthesis